ncbi:MAG: metallophosphoesterase, partial [Lachnospiraceae bacterium]|nr:metallophosphoesterase [Lachnospiraceae bacterium]
MRRILKILLPVLIVCMLAGCGTEAPYPAADPAPAAADREKILNSPLWTDEECAHIMVVSDLHYLAPSLYRDSGLFLRSLRRGDGKITQYGEELFAALYQEILQEKPDALIVTGDLTFNGE